MLRILVVDDERSYRDSLRSMLLLKGYQVETAEGDHDAVDLGMSFKPDVLVVDWMLRNHKDGLEVAEVLRAANPRMQVIVITGYPTPNIEAQVETIPYAQFLAKPFTLTDLIAALERASKNLD
jgi:DNA-binding NtrC family response regulator